ncbi:uncharacterized protein LOC122063009 [Macadamia integrifolia]|uniref:uncharacterized protein LOC122063009 n=1 Tax=Macadamia integrifolia TaxID=60698 RepID=UPI001C4E65B8|nr:uncharacterized protein LOC122063009 [Macadamia integrifolia]
MLRRLLPWILGHNLPPKSQRDEVTIVPPPEQGGRSQGGPRGQVRGKEPAASLEYLYTPCYGVSREQSVFDDANVAPAMVIEGALPKDRSHLSGMKFSSFLERCYTQLAGDQAVLGKVLVRAEQ